MAARGGVHEDTRGFKGCAERETRDGPFSTPADDRWIVRSLRPATTVTRHPTGENPSKYYRVKSSRSLLLLLCLVCLGFPSPRVLSFPLPSLSTLRTVRRTTKENRVINAHLDWILIIIALSKDETIPGRVIGQFI